MAVFLKKYSTPILFFVLLTLLILAWRFPAIGLKLGIIFLLITLLTAGLAILEKHKQAYRAGQITRSIFIRNAALEFTGVLLAMSLAGWLGRPLAKLATQGIEDDLIHLVAGMVVGLLAGMGIGLLVRQMWGQLIRG